MVVTGFSSLRPSGNDNLGGFFARAPTLDEAKLGIVIVGEVDDVTISDPVSQEFPGYGHWVPLGFGDKLCLVGVAPQALAHLWSHEPAEGADGIVHRIDRDRAVLSSFRMIHL